MGDGVMVDLNEVCRFSGPVRNFMLLLQKVPVLVLALETWEQLESEIRAKLRNLQPPIDQPEKPLESLRSL